VRSKVVQHDPKLPYDSGEISKPNRVVGGSIHDCEIVSLLDGRVARSSSTSCVPK
jgi:hypothetical protein